MGPLVVADGLAPQHGGTLGSENDPGTDPDVDLDHVAVAVEQQAVAWPRYGGDLPSTWIGGGGTPGFRSAQVEFANGMKVEVLEPYLVEHNDFLRRFLDRNGAGPHHLTFKVKDIVGAIARAEEAGYRPVGVNLADDFWKEAFLHPKDAPGVVVQLAQQADGGDWGTDGRRRSRRRRRRRSWCRRPGRPRGRAGGQPRGAAASQRGSVGVSRPPPRVSTPRPQRDRGERPWVRRWTR